jgi:ribosomal-protein-alanine N-acetyltransferase
MNNPQIRILQIHSLQALIDIENQNDFPWTANMLHDCFIAGYEIYGMELNNKIVAYAVIRLMMSDEAEILNIAVDKNFRRKGYGKLLLQFLLQTCKQKNVTRIYLEVRVSNAAALHLYENFGFKKIGARAEYYPAAQGREDAVILSIEYQKTKKII